MSLTSMKILTEMANLQYRPGKCDFKAILQVWGIYWWNWLSCRVHKDDGNWQTDRRTDACDDNNPWAEEAEG